MVINDCVVLEFCRDYIQGIEEVVNLQVVYNSTNPFKFLHYSFAIGLISHFTNRMG